MQQVRAAESSRLRAYIVVSLLTGARTEELRALTWEHVDLDGQDHADPPVPPSIEVWHSTRAGGDTKTRKSRRTLALPARCVRALRSQRQQQDEDRAEAGTEWQPSGLVFTSTVATALDAHNVRRAFRQVAKAAGLDAQQWTPRELRHSFRLAPVRQRSADRGHRRPVRLRRYDGHRVRLLSPVAACPAQRSRRDGPDLLHGHRSRPVVTRLVTQA